MFDALSSVNVTGEKTTSLDIPSIFTNVPPTEINCLLCAYIENDRLDIGVHYLKEILLRCTLDVQFKFDNEFYRQTDGIAIRSLLEPLLADRFIANLQNTILRSSLDSFCLYKDY